MPFGPSDSRVALLALAMPRMRSSTTASAGEWMTVFLRRLMALGVLVPSMLVPTYACRRVDVPPAVRLEETIVILLPDSLEVSGAAASSSDEFVLWSRPQQRAWTVRGEEPIVPLIAPGVYDPVAAAHTGQVVEIVDARTNSLLRWTPDGEFLEARQFEPDGRIVAADHGSAGWLFVASNAGSQAMLRFDGRRLEGVGSWQDDDGRALSPQVWLRAWGSGAIVSEARYPFRWRLLATSGARIRGAPGAHGPAADSSSGSIGFPVLPIEGGFLQTIADLRSPQRLLILYNAEGVPVRTTRFAVPMAFVAAVRSRRLLVAVRRTDRLELVLYRWMLDG